MILQWVSGVLDTVDAVLDRWQADWRIRRAKRFYFHRLIRYGKPFIG